MRKLLVLLAPFVLVACAEREKPQQENPAPVQQPVTAADANVGKGRYGNIPVMRPINVPLGANNAAAPAPCAAAPSAPAPSAAPAPTPSIKPQTAK